MAAPESTAVEVVYALRDRQRVIQVRFAEGMTAIEAIEASGLLKDFPELAGRGLDLGVYGRVVQSTHLLRPGDRVEIYRRLAANPREARRQLAAQGRTGGSQPPGRRGRPG
jgi:putative ubiquitin-RnfH superfamily antitoxin RatB of RatAB toxin-antitoxin module